MDKARNRRIHNESCRKGSSYFFIYWFLAYPLCQKLGDEAKKKQSLVVLKTGLAIETCGVLGACIGGLPTDPYIQNVGLIVTTKVVAKRVFTIVGGLMLVAGLFPKFVAIMTTIPFPVLGGATITVFAAITMSGIQLITEHPMNYRNKMIVGIALALGVGISSLSLCLQYFPPEVQSIIGTSTIVVSFAVAFLLNIITPEDHSKPNH